MPEQMLTITFRTLPLTRMQEETLEEAATIYAQGVVALCRWAEANLDFQALAQREVDANAVRALLPDPRLLVPPVESLHSCLRDDLLSDAAGKIASFVGQMVAHREGWLPERPGYWASVVREPPPWEELLEEAIVRELLEDEEFLRWQGGLLSHGWLARARRPQLGEQLLFLRVKGTRGCHLLVRERSGQLQAAAVVYVGRQGLYPRLVLDGSAGWWDLAEGREGSCRTSSALYIPLQATSPYLQRYLRMGLEGQARPAAARMFRRRRDEGESWAWYLAVTFRVQCPEPYEPAGWLVAEAGWQRGEGPRVVVGLPGGEGRELFQDYWEGLRGVMRSQFRERARLQRRGRDISGLHAEGAAWEETLHRVARELVDMAREGGLGVEWRGGAPRRLKRLPEVVLRKARLVGVPARWVGRRSTAKGEAGVE